jgi:flagellar hook-length control protein FliK
MNIPITATIAQLSLPAATSAGSTTYSPVMTANASGTATSSIAAKAPTFESVLSSITKLATASDSTTHPHAPHAVPVPIRPRPSVAISTPNDGKSIDAPPTDQTGDTKQSRKPAKANQAANVCDPSSVNAIPIPVAATIPANVPVAPAAAGASSVSGVPGGTATNPSVSPPIPPIAGTQILSPPTANSSAAAGPSIPSTVTSTSTSETGIPTADASQPTAPFVAGTGASAAVSAIPTGTLPVPTGMTDPSSTGANDAVSTAQQQTGGQPVGDVTNPNVDLTSQVISTATAESSVVPPTTPAIANSSTTSVVGFGSAASENTVVTAASTLADLTAESTVPAADQILAAADQVPGLPLTNPDLKAAANVAVVQNDVAAAWWDSASVSVVATSGTGTNQQSGAQPDPGKSGSGAGNVVDSAGRSDSTSNAILNASVANTLPAAPSGTTGTPSTVTTQLTDAIVQRAPSLSNGDSTSVVLRLDPPDLGQVKLHVSMTNDVVSIRMIASDEGARQVIDRQMNDLRQSLSDQGISVNQCQVDCNTSGSQQSFDQTWGQRSYDDWQTYTSAMRKMAANPPANSSQPSSRTQLDYVA